MKRKSRFFVNAASLAAVNIFLRSVSVSFNAYVSAKIGAESMGLFTLVMSVYGMAVTLATSGVNLASVRLTAERTATLAEAASDGAGFRRCVGSVMRSCISYSMLFSVSSGALLFLLSPVIGEHLLGDTRTVLSLKVLAVSLPAISVTSALSGCFTGLRKVYKNAASAIIEQGTKIILTSTALAMSFPPFMDSVEYACLAVVGGAAVAEGMSLLINIVMYIFDTKRPSGVAVGTGMGKFKKTRIRDTAAVSLPVALGAYARQGLSTAEHLAIPWGMKKNGMNSADALASYGILHGMVFPLILFPSAVISSAAGLLIPELAEFRALGQKERIYNVVQKVLFSSLVFSIGCAGVFMAFSDGLGLSVYGSVEAGSMIRATAPLIPVMYFDTTVDCMLKGLGEQVHSMHINIIDSASSLILVLLLVPFLGIGGYIISVYFCECLNCALSLHRLRKITGAGAGVVRCTLTSVVCITVSVVVVKTFHGLSVSAGITVCAVIYLALSVIFGRVPDLREKRKRKFKNNVEIGA